MQVLVQVLVQVLTQGSRKIAPDPNSNTNPKPNPNPDRGAIFWTPLHNTLNKLFILVEYSFSKKLFFTVHMQC